jgi:predicted dehydrogenase
MVISSLSCLHDGWLKSMQISVSEGLWQQETTQRYAYTADAKNGMLVEPLRQTDLIHIATQLGATLLDIAGGHMLDILQYLLGRFRVISATTSSLFPTVTITETGEVVKKTGEDHIALSGILDSDVVATISFRTGYPPVEGERFLWEIQGTEGLIRMTDEPGGTSWINQADPRIYLNGEQVRYEKGDLETNISNGWKEFAKGYDGAYATLEDAVRLHKLIDAIRTSAKEGRRVDI